MKKVIAIDNGHGLNTLGKRTPIFPNTNKFIHEWEFNHAVAKKVGEILKRHNFIILYTSDTEKDTPLEDRTNLANEWDVDLFISIHYNALTGEWGKHGGIETYHYPTSKSGKKLADLIHGELIKATHMRDRGVKSANFHVLRETNMPSVLLECGFMDNLDEAKLMLDEEYQDKCSIAISKGICKYFNVEYKEIQEEKKGKNKLYKVQVGAYSVKENADNLLKQLEAKGFNGFISETETDTEVKPLSQYYEKHELKIIETEPSNIYVSTLPGKNLREFGVYGINGTWQNNEESHLTRSIWGLVANIKGAIGPNSYQNSPNGHKRGTIIYYEDGTIETKRINNIKEINKPILWAIGGGSLIPNLINESFADDIYRYTLHTALGYKGKRIHLIVTESYCEMEEFRERVLKLNLDSAIFLDGGGSTQMNYKDNKGLYSSRGLSHGVFLKQI